MTKLRILVNDGLRLEEHVVECDVWTVVNGQTLMLGNTKGNRVVGQNPQSGQPILEPDVDHFRAYGPHAWHSVERID